MCDVCGRTPSQPTVDTSDEGKLFAVVAGEGSTYCLKMICTTRRYAESLCGNSHRVEDFDCVGKPKATSYPVYVVSVGEDEKYRVVELGLVKNLAHQVAVSINGTVSIYKAISSTPEASDTRFHRWFIPLGPSDHDADYYYADTGRRRVLVYDNQEPAPTITRRRRYDDGLPYRFEIMDTDRNRSGIIAEQISEGVHAELFPKTLEYNVEYTLVFNKDQDKWEVDPCLL